MPGTPSRRRPSGRGGPDAAGLSSRRRVALPVRGQIRATRKRQRQGKRERVGGVHAAEVPGAGAASGQLGGVERPPATIAQRFEHDREKLLQLPAAPCESCERRTTRVNLEECRKRRDCKLWGQEEHRPVAVERRPSHWPEPFHRRIHRDRRISRRARGIAAVSRGARWTGVGRQAVSGKGEIAIAAQPV